MAHFIVFIDALNLHFQTIFEAYKLLHIVSSSLQTIARVASAPVLIMLQPCVSVAVSV